jgi:hypothetical protein
MELYGRHQETAVLRENLLFAAQPWGFDLSGSGWGSGSGSGSGSGGGPPVAIWQGGKDRGCTPAMALHLAEQMGPRATATVVGQQGHMLYFDCWEEVVSWVNGLGPA